MLDSMFILMFITMNKKRDIVHWFNVLSIKNENKASLGRKIINYSVLFYRTMNIIHLQ